MFLYGAGGHAKSVRDNLRSYDISVDGVYDDNPEKNQFMELKVTHSLEEVDAAIVCVGDNQTRKTIVRKLLEKGIPFGLAIHRSAMISPDAEIGEGSVVMAGAVINSGAKIGRHCIINSGAVVEHDCVIGDFVHIASHATLSGAVTVEEGSLVCPGAVVTQGKSIGKWSQIGAGAVVLKNIPDGVMAYGIPCRIVKHI